MKISALLALLVSSLFVSVVSGQERSEAFQRYAAGELKFELDSEFFPKFNYKLVTGLGYNGDPNRDPLIQKKLGVYRKNSKALYLIRLHGQHKDLQAAYHLRNAIDGFVENTTFRDPTSPIKVGDTYHVWYSKSWGTPPVGPNSDQASQEAWQDIKGKWKRVFSWDFVSIWHATSKDGYHWTEQGVALEPGPAGSYDDRCVFTPDVLVADGRYYLYYQVAKSPHVYKQGPHHIAVAWSDSPEGPWRKSDAPILHPGKSDQFDSLKVHDPCVIVKGCKYYLYYKGHGADTVMGKPFHIGWGVAIANQPEGPFVKSELNPLVCGGHEVMIFPYRSGVAGLVRQGPELFSMQYAEDGLNFKLVSHVTDVPHAGTFFRAGHFRDIDRFPADLPKWGLCHGYRLGSSEAFIVRYDLSFPSAN